MMVENVDLWIGILMGVIVFTWPWVVTARLKHLTQAELVEISTDYDGINLAYFLYMLLSLLITIILIFLVLSVIDQYELEQKGIIIMVWSTVLFSILGFSQGLFALRKGVYPTSKFFGGRTTYAHSKGDRVKRLGRQQVYSALIAIACSFLLGLVRWWSGL